MPAPPPAPGSGLAQDGTVLSLGGKPEALVAYVVPSADSRPAGLEASSSATLPKTGAPPARVPVASLPLTSTGEIDAAKLRRVPVVDSNLVQRWEEALRARPEIDRVAVLVHEDADPPPRLHLDDLLPDCRPGQAGAASGQASPSQESSAARTASRPWRPPALVHGPALPDSPDYPETLPAALERAARTPLPAALVHHRADGAPDDVQTFAELLLDAERILAGLRASGVALGSNVLLILDRNQDILPAFWGCVLGGFVPLIASAPAGAGDSLRALDQLRSLHGQLSGPFVLTAQSLGAELYGWLAELTGSPERLGVIEELRQSAPDSRHHASRPDDLAFFSSTSGSTGTPKCVMLTHRAVLSRARGADALCASSPDDLVLNWLPFDHIGSLSDWHLRCVALRCRSVYVAKEVILAQPLRWLDLIDRYRITHTWAPTFAYRLVGEALARDLAAPWDLSSLKGLLSAGEHVSFEAEAALLRRLGPCGLSSSALWTAFGMAETASGITYDRPLARPGSERPQRHLFVDRGSLDGEIEEVGAGDANAAVFSSLGGPIQRMSLRIVDDAGTVLPERTVGRLQVKGEAVCLGFYQDPEATREALGADGWFDTGDRGFLAEGRLVLTGRGKDAIVVNGANYASSEIEAVVEEVHGSLVSFTAACSVRRRGHDAFELAVFFPAGLSADTGLPNLLRAVKRRVAQRLGFTPTYLVPLPKSDLAKTAIGKLRRQELKRRFEAGDFDHVLKEVDLALGNENTLPAWFFRPQWRLAQARNRDAAAPQGAVLVFADGDGLGGALRNRIDGPETACIVVERGAEFEKLEPRRYRMAAGDLGQTLRLLAAVKEEAGVVGEVLHLWNVRPSAGEVGVAADLERAQEPGIFSVLTLAQALCQSQGPDHPVRLLVAQSCSEAVLPADEVACERTPLRALVGSLERELPWLQARHLDLPVEAVATSADRVMAERNVADAGSGRVAYRGADRFVLRIEKLNLAQQPAGVPFFKQNGAYVICGSGDGFGQALADHLRASHAARVLCVDDEVRRDPRLLEDRIAEARAGWGTGLDGVISLSDLTPRVRPLLEESRAALWARLEADLVAPWTLRRIAEGERGCAFLLLSSPFDLFPALGSGALGLAASFQDGLAAPSPGRRKPGAYSYRCAPWRSTYGGPDAAGDAASAHGLHELRVEQALASCLAGLRRGEKNLVLGLDAGDRRVRRLTENDDPALEHLTACFSADTLLDTETLSQLTIPDLFGTPSRCRFRQLREPAHAPPLEIELWPSVAEHFVYDDLIYYALAHDERRNRSYRKAIDLLVRGKVVLDVGTGKEAILARFCAEGGARKVYAVELGEAAWRSAVEKVKALGLADTITVLHGDAQRIALPEAVDVCVSEVVGPIGGSEGAAPLLNGVRRLLKRDGVMIPSRSITRIAAVRLPDPLLDKPRFRVVPGAYARKIFAQVGYPFDLRVCIKNFPRSHVLSNADTFEDMDFAGPVEAEFRRSVRLEIHQAGRLDGVLLWLNLHTMDGEVIDILEEEYVWLPVYFPLFSPGVQVQPGDVLEATCGGSLSDNGLNPDYHVEGRLTRRGGESLSFRHHSYHHRRVLEESPFYERLFAGGRILPDPTVPQEATVDFLAEMPLTQTGDVDRERLFAQMRPGKGEGRARAAPGSEVQRRIAAIWQDLLKLPEVGLDENFFELGGHSLLLVQAQGQLQEAFGPRVTLVELFKHPTIQSLAEFLAEPAEGAATPASHGLERARRRATRQGGPQRTDIAVIGMACRFPGADDLAQFWRNLRGGVESITFFSPEEVARSGVSRVAREHPDYVRASAILSDVESFDAEFFEYTPHQARLMDPQHRLALECAWECLESAGYDPFACDEIIGIYAGASMNTYLLNQVLPNRHRLDHNDDLRVTTLDSLGGFELMLANDKDYLTTRIAYKLNLRGPAITAQTACSTSLVTIHMACQSLIAGECDMALAGGVSVQVPQRAGHLYQESIMVSPDGHCRAFDARAAGTVFGSGVGMVLLKPLVDAQRDGDALWAVVKGSAVNNDGHRKLNYMAPSGDGQAAVLAQALGMSEVDASTISYVEAHGTGTILGDPIEIEGLSQVFRAATERKGFCAVGSVKTNVGHLQIASGIAGFIKAVLALHHEELPPSLHFERANPQIDFASSPFFVNTELRPWPRGQAPRRAGVNSLGIGGTNAHVILEEAPPAAPATGDAEPTCQLFTLSARNATALRELARRHLEHLSANGSVALDSLCHTVNGGRRHFRHRAAATVGSVADVVAALRVLSAGAGTVAGLVRGEAPRKERPLLAFTCAPEGAERAGMGRRLFDTLPVFREAIEHCGEALRPHLKTPLAELLYGDGRGEAKIARAQDGHPALFAVEAALCEVWRSFGIVPGLLHGRGVGEYVSAWASGILTLEDAVLLVFERALALEAAGKGAPDSSSFGRRIRGLVLRPPRLEVAPAARGASAADMVRPDYWIHGLASSTASASSGSSELPLPDASLSLEIGPAGSDWPCLSSSLGLLYTRGLDVDWKALHPGRRPQRLALPTYPFQRQRFWMDVADAGDPPPRT